MDSNYKIILGTTPVELLGEPRVNISSFTFDLQNGLARVVAEYSYLNTETKVKEFNVTTQELTNTGVVDLDNLRYLFDSAINNKSSNIIKTIFNTVNKRKKDKNTPTLNIENIPTNKDCINSIKRQLKNKGYKID